MKNIYENTGLEEKVDVCGKHTVECIAMSPLHVAMFRRMWQKAYKRISKLLSRNHLTYVT